MKLESALALQETTLTDEDYAADLAKKLGLTALAKDDKKHAQLRRAQGWMEKHRLSTLDPVTNDLIERFYPRVYRNDRSNKTSSAWVMSFEQFSHQDGIPIRVREMMVEADKVFDALEIRTIEGRPDPVLSGILKLPGNRESRVFLSRWGESIVPWKDIKRVVSAADQDQSGIRVPFGISLLLSALIFYALSFHPDADIPFRFMALFLAIVGAVALPWKRLSLIFRPDLKSHLRRLSPVYDD